MADQFDIILISGEPFVDHPLSGVGVITKVLQEAGFKVGVISKPDWKKDEDFLKLGKPKLFFGVTAGAIDSMLSNYTPLKKRRDEDKHKPFHSGIPDRAVITYCNKLRQLFKETPIMIGGVEASLRRFAHYDYWDNSLRKSILVDSRASILVYGNGEYQAVEIAKRLAAGKPLQGIQGTCVLANEVPASFTALPSFEEVKKSKEDFCKAQVLFSNNKDLCQKQDTRYLLQYKMHHYTSGELDHIYGLDYSRNIPKDFPEFRMAQFSVVTHRGCIGGCNFCSISLLQGNRIISRSESSILKEIEKITKHRDFKGVIDDIGGPSANMYGMDCEKCDTGKCMSCRQLNRSHYKLINLMRRARAIPGVKKIFIRSGIRYDLAVESEEYIKELGHHISGCLKIAPEHVSPKVLKLMNKYSIRLNDFRKLFDKHNKPLGHELKYYFMTGHPGSGMQEAKELAHAVEEFKNAESVQLFTPTPMSVSTCMYYTGLNPFTMEKIYVPYTYNEKKEQKNRVFERKDELHDASRFSKKDTRFDRNRPTPSKPFRANKKKYK